ncbi:hypothetical protein Fmac_028245 [Flemingia macrophylla]|uniref:LITAF domain-containing protein n=1 Tax=Flemingia macrophylla TaxID=520843 RepID=A0ABD1L6Z9_9FABA
MEVTLTQSNEEESEVEEVGLQRRTNLQLSSSTGSGNTSNKGTEVEGGGLKLEFDESETKAKFDIIRTEYAEMIQQHEETENTTTLPASNLPLPEYSTSLKNVTSKIVTVGTMKETDEERRELYLERVFEIPPTHGFYCPNCNSCIQKVYIQKGEWEQVTAPIQPLQPIEQIRCSSCFSFLIPIGSWFFPGLESGEGTTKSAIIITDDKGKQSLETTEKVAPPGIEPSQIVASEVEDNIKKSEDSSSRLSVTSEDLGKSKIAPKKKYFWSDWAVIGDASEASKIKQAKTESSEKSEWKVISAASPATIPRQPEIDILDEKQQKNLEVKIKHVQIGKYHITYYGHVIKLSILSVYYFYTKII